MRKHIGDAEAGMYENVIMRNEILELLFLFIYYYYFNLFFMIRLLFRHLDVSDPICHQTYFIVLRGIAGENSAIYDELDGSASYYKNKSIKSFQEALSTKVNRSYYDPHIRDICARIRGFLIFHPLDFLCENDITSNGKSASSYPQSLWI